jgi:hypothetical protein
MCVLPRFGHSFKKVCPKIKTDSYKLLVERIITVKVILEHIRGG